jgi:hypothetical protein
MSEKRESLEGVYGAVPQDPRDMVKAALPEPPISSGGTAHSPLPRLGGGAITSVLCGFCSTYPSRDGRCAASTFKGMNGAPTSRSDVQHHRNAGWPTGRESQGHGVLVVVWGGESPLRGEGGRGDGMGKGEGCEMHTDLNLSICRQLES